MNCLIVLIPQFFLSMTLTAVELPKLVPPVAAEHSLLQRRVVLLDTIGESKNVNYNFSLQIYPSFGHQIWHNFGATHNPEEFETTSGDGYAHLILVKNVKQAVQAYTDQFSQQDIYIYIFQTPTLQTNITMHIWMGPIAQVASVHFHILVYVLARSLGRPTLSH